MVKKDRDGGQMSKRTKTEFIIIHCSASKKDTSAATIASWHLNRGFKKGGYHKLFFDDGRVIRFSEEKGNLDIGRGQDEVGAHCKNWNSVSIGYCWIGGCEGQLNISEAQFEAMINECKKDMGKYGIPTDKVLGHRETGANKLCPIIDMDIFRATLMGEVYDEKVDIWEPDESVFTDLNGDHWAYDELVWAVQEAKLFEGIDSSVGTIIEPDRQVTRAELAIMFKRFDKYLKGI